VGLLHIHFQLGFIYFQQLTPHVTRVPFVNEAVGCSAASDRVWESAVGAITSGGGFDPPTPWQIEHCMLQIKNQVGEI